MHERGRYQIHIQFRFFHFIFQFQIFFVGEIGGMRQKSFSICGQLDFLFFLEIENKFLLE